MTKDDIKHMLRTNDRALARGIVAIYRRQLADEQQAQATMHDNGVGFNSADAAPMSAIARALLRGDTIGTDSMRVARERMPKYASQLLEIATSRSLGI